MKADAIKLDGKKAGSVDLVRRDLRARAARRHPAPCGSLAAQQCAGRYAQGETRSETNYSTKKIYRQKGHRRRTPRVAQRADLPRGGVYKGPTPRSHGHDLTKKFRNLALSTRFRQGHGGELVIIDTADFKDAKTGALAKQVKNLGWKTCPGDRRCRGE